jgi:hypothetical protein
MGNRLSTQLTRQVRARAKLRHQVDAVALDWAERPPEEREQMRRELAPALDLLETAIRESYADEYTQAEQVARGATTRTSPLRH